MDYQETLYVPDIDENIPLPDKATEALPELSMADELMVRANTIKLLSDLAGIPIIPSVDDQHEAEMLAKAMVTDPSLKPHFAKYPNQTIAYLAGMVSQYNCQIVDDLADLKQYVINRLVKEIEEATSAKDRIAALGRLGEIEGVDAFKRRTEMTVVHKPIQEVEKELLNVIEALEFHTIPPVSSPPAEANSEKRA